MSACSTFTEHVWKPGECKNCFKPKSLHCITAGSAGRSSSQTPAASKQLHQPSTGAKTNSQRASAGSLSRSGHFRPPVAKKPTIAVKPTMMLPCSSARPDSDGTVSVIEPGKTSAFTVWNHNGLNCKNPCLSNNNNEGEDRVGEIEGYGPLSPRTPSGNNNSGLTDVLKEIAGLGPGPSPGPLGASKDIFWDRISSSYRRSLERGLPASSCLALGSGSSSNGGCAATKHVSLSDGRKIISTEGGRYCYPEYSSEGEDEEEEEEEDSERDLEEDEDDEHESWEESDEELLAMEIRMRGQPRFANFRAATLSPVRFAAGKKWNTVPLRNRSLQRICAVDYDDSYDEILNDHPSMASSGALLPYRSHDMHGSGFLTNAESTTSAEPSSSQPDESYTPTSSDGSFSSAFMSAVQSPSPFKSPEPCTSPKKESVQRALSPIKVTETHKAVLAIRLEDQDGREGTKMPQALPGQPVTISFSPTEEQAKPYRVVNLEKSLICKPYTVVDVSASMASKEEHVSDAKHRNVAMPVTPTQVCNPLRAQPLSPASPVQIISTALSTSASVHTTTTSQKKLGSIRYQEVWTSSTSPRQKMPKVDVGVSTRGNNHTPSNSQRFCHKSAPTSPVAGPSSSRTVPIKSPNLSEIKFNSFNNAGMPPFPIIIRDEPAYVRSSKNAVKVPIVINPSAYDNLAVYKSFLGLSGELPQGKSMSSRATSHTYEEIGSSESVQSSSAEKTISRNGHSEEASGEESKVKSPVLHSPTPHDSTETVTPAPIPSSMHSNPASSADVRKSPVSVSLKNGCKESNTCNELVKDSHESTGSHRGEASSVLSQIVSSIHPPQSPPEALPALSKTFSSEELYSIPPDAVKETLTRPKSFFSSTDVCLSTRNTPTKVLFKSQSASASVPLSTAQSEPSVPFPPPRSTSSPYHASNILQRHFGNWTKSSACSSPSRPVDGEASPSKEGRRVSAEGSKPKRWISFKSFFRRRKEEDEQKVQKEKGKLVGLDGTVIHVLPPPPAQKQSWFTEARAEDPSQKPTIIFTYKPESGSGDDALQVNDGGDASHSTPAADRESRLEGPGTTTELQSIEENSVAKELSRVQGGSGAARERDLPGFITPLPAHINLDLVFGVRENNHVGPGTVHGADEREDDASGLSHSPASSQCSATYSNLGQSRANMIPLKHPRNIKASNDTLASIDLDGPTDPPSLKGTPPPLPKKIVHRSSTEPGKEPVRGSLKSWAEVKPGGTNLSVANPLYDLDSTWDTASQSSSLSSEPQRAPGVESGDSLERPAAKSTNKTRPANSMSSLVHPPPPPKERTFPSMESLAGRNRRTQQGPGASKPQRAALYRGLESWDEVVGKIRGLHTDTLRKLAAKCEDRFMAGQKDHLRFGTDSWSHFRLTTGRPCCEAGDAVYFTASYAKDPLVNYAIKICRSTMKETQQQFFHSLAVRQSLAVHFNIQQDCGHFLADVPARMLPWEEEEEDEEDEEEDKEEVEKEDGNRERPEGPDPQSGEDPGLSSAAHLRSRVVVITREVPFQTVADFVREGVSRHGQQPELYERQVCLLLLQLCAGLEHMKPHHVTHCDLRLENLLLVQCQPGRLDSPELNNNNSSAGASSAASATSAAGATCPARLIISNFSQAKQKSALLAADPGTLRDQSRLAPEIITATQYRKCDEFQTGILIYEMLHRPNPFEVTPELKEREYTWADLPALPVRSLYSQGLQQLARLLLTVNPSERIRMSEARACLQCLLWGPREDLFQALGCSGPDQRDVTLQNWLDLKRTLMMIKFAERSLDSGSGVSLEDWLCCQYLAFASTDSLSRVVHILQLPSKPSHATQNQAHAAHNCHSTQPL